MFSTLTADELEKLAQKLSRAGTAFCRKADSIGSTAIYLKETGRIEVSSDEWNGLWNLRRPLIDLMDEMHALMREVDAAAASKETASA